MVGMDNGAPAAMVRYFPFDSLHPCSYQACPAIRVAFCAASFAARSPRAAAGGGYQRNADCAGVVFRTGRHGGAGCCCVTRALLRGQARSVFTRNN